MNRRAMRSHATIATLALVGAMPSAWAQGTSSLTLYGSLDAGLTYIDNAKGRSRKDVGSGSKLANRFGFRGSEDLGGAWRALFLIEGGLNVNDGTLTLGGRPWGRQAYVGLAHAQFGALTMGRQYDFLYAGSPMPLDLGALLVGGLAGATAGAGTAVDNHLGGVRCDNAVKWQGRFDTYTVGLMTALGAENSRDKMANAVIAYRDRGLWLGASYLRDNFSAPTSGNRIGVLSANVDVNMAWKLVLNLSSSRADVPADTRSRNHMVQGGALYQVSAPWVVGLMLGHSDTRNAAGVDGRIDQLGLGTAYALSRRTELYGIHSSVRTAGSAGTAFSSLPGIGGPAAQLRSSDNRQAVLKAGIRHSF